MAIEQNDLLECFPEKGGKWKAAAICAAVFLFLRKKE